MTEGRWLKSSKGRSSLRAPAVEFIAEVVEFTSDQSASGRFIAGVVELTERSSSSLPKGGRQLNHCRSSRITAIVEFTPDKVRWSIIGKAVELTPEVVALTTDW